MTMTSFVWKEMRRQPGRTLLTLAGIIIGVQALVAIPMAIETTRSAYQSLFEGLTGRADLEVVAFGGGGFDVHLAERMQALDAVAAALPTVQETAALRTPSGVTPILIMGIEVSDARPFGEYRVAVGDNLGAASGTVGAVAAPLLLQRDFAEAQDIGVGDSVRLLTARGLRELLVVGLIVPRGARAINAGALGIVPLAVAQQHYGLVDQANNIQLILEEGTHAAAAQAAIAEQLPQGLTVRSPTARAALAGRSLTTTEQLLSTLSVVSLATGAFVILNSFLMSVGERRRELAVLRSLGATRGQTSALLMREAACLGIIGTIIGIPLGIGMAHVMMMTLEQMMTVPLPPPRITALPIVGALILGPGVALLATWWPARQAGRRSPLQTLSERPSGDPDTVTPRWTLFAALTVFSAGGVFYMATLLEQVPKEVFVFALPVVLSLGIFGCAALVPWIVGPLSRLAESMWRPVLGMEGKLAARQLRRHRTRTALVVGVLAVSVMVSLAFGNAIILSLDDVYEWFDHIIVSDFMVRGHMPEPSAVLTASMPEELEVELAALPGVREVGKLTFIPAQAAGHQIFAMAMTWSGSGPLGIDLIEGDPQRVRAGLMAGEIVVGSHLAQQADVKIGDTIDLSTRQGPRPLKIVGVATEYTGGGTVIYGEWTLLKSLLKPTGVHVFFVDAEPGALSSVETALQPFCDANGVWLQSRAMFRADLDEMMEGVLGSFWGLLAMVFVVASLGVTNAVTMNVLEQTREIGILRAVAMKRRQVCKMILAQALAMGTVSLLPGALGGLVLGYLVSASTYAITGIIYAYHVDWVLFGGCLLLALLLAAGAALPPVLRVARLSVIRALQYE